MSADLVPAPELRRDDGRGSDAGAGAPSSLTERLDRFQRTHRRTGVALAVVYKFADDQGNYLAALITYYAFVSLFPLLLLASTVLSFVLHGEPGLQRTLLESALREFPVVGQQLTHPGGLSGGTLGVVIGLLGTVYGGLGVAQAAQNAMNTIWRVPRNSRPNPLLSRARSLLLLAVMAVAIFATTGLAALGSVGSVGALVKVALGAATFLLNTAVFTIAFRIATARECSLRETLPGALGAAVLWQVLQYFGAIYVSHVVRGASEINGVFAVVLGLLAWLYLEAMIIVFAAEYNSVRSLRLHPRSLLTPFTDDVELTRADRENYRAQAEAARAKGFERIHVRFHPRRHRGGQS